MAIGVIILQLYMGIQNSKKLEYPMKYSRKNMELVCNSIFIYRAEFLEPEVFGNVELERS